MTNVTSCTDLTVTLTQDVNPPVFLNIDNITNEVLTAKNTSNSFIIPFKATAQTNIEFLSPTDISDGNVLVRVAGINQQDMYSIYDDVIPIPANSSGLIVLNTFTEKQINDELLHISKYEPQTLPYQIVMFDESVNEYVEASFDGTNYTTTSNIVNGSDSSSFILNNITSILPDSYWTENQYYNHGSIYLQTSLGRLEVRDEVNNLTQFVFTDHDFHWPGSNSNILVASNAANSQPETQVSMVIKVIDYTNNKLVVDLYIGQDPNFDNPTLKDVSLLTRHMHNFYIDEETGIATCKDIDCNMKGNISKITIPGGIDGFRIHVITPLPSDSTVVLYGSGFYLEIDNTELTLADYNPSEFLLYIVTPEGYEFDRVETTDTTSNKPYDIYLKRKK